MKTQLAPVCRTCTRPLDVHPATGRPPWYCSTECRRVGEFAIRRIQRRLQSLEDQVSEARLAEALADTAYERRRPRQKQAALSDEILRMEDRLRSLVDGGA